MAKPTQTTNVFSLDSLTFEDPITGGGGGNDAPVVTTGGNDILYAADRDKHLVFLGDVSDSMGETWSGCSFPELDQARGAVYTAQFADLYNEFQAHKGTMFRRDYRTTPYGYTLELDAWEQVLTMDPDDPDTPDFPLEDIGMIRSINAVYAKIDWTDSKVQDFLAQQLHPMGSTLSLDYIYERMLGESMGRGYTRLDVLKYVGAEVCRSRFQKHGKTAKVSVGSFSSYLDTYQATATEELLIAAIRRFKLGGCTSGGHAIMEVLKKLPAESVSYHHFVMLTDGGITDRDVFKDAIAELRQRNIRLDWIVCLEDDSGTMYSYMDSLKKEYKKQIESTGGEFLVLGRSANLLRETLLLSNRLALPPASNKS